MTTTTRQTSLLVAEDWKKVYQTFRNADFQSYDFETLRKTMIDYLRLYYPEDFNDFIESSEYIALIDLIAFLGQSLAFRGDMNARENFLDTAERRDSILRLARLVSYNPKRSTSASGYLKIESISTTESLTDSNGNDLANSQISWNDPTNSNWDEQFNAILNACLVNSQLVGKPGNTQTINNVSVEEYAINLTQSQMPVFGFTSVVNDITMAFEAVSATSVGQTYIYEPAPRPTGRFNILRMNDGRGNGSNNTGFFVHFKQGTLATDAFSLTETTPNQVINVNYTNVNNSDVWLYDVTVLPATLWKQVPAIAGINVIYNSIEERNLYQVSSRTGDQISLVFGDGSFANIPQGKFSVYFRQSNGLQYKIVPDELQNVPISINYVSRSGRVETLTVRASLKYTINNANSSESLDDVRQKAPQQYYTQGRMITGEDYNIVPFTKFSNILKVKAVNRTSSGVSRFLDVIDSSGKYSSTNIFADDGHLYRENIINQQNYAINNSSTAQKVVKIDLPAILSSKEMAHFYYAYITRNTMSDTAWSLCNVVSNGSSGYFYNSASSTTSPIQVGYTTSSNAKHIRAGAILKFVPLDGYYFNNQNQMVSGTVSKTGDKAVIYASVMNIIGDGTNGGSGAFADGTGPITLNQKIPSGAKLVQVIPVFKTSLETSMVTEIVSRIVAYGTFGLRYDTITELWYIVEPEDLGSGTYDPTAVSSAGNKSGLHLDNSWLVKFEYNSAIGHTISSRGLNYVFESTNQTKFYFDNDVKVFDSQSGSTVFDQIRVLKVNSQPDSSLPLSIDYVWHIFKNIIESDGYENQNKVLLTFPDSNNDGIPDNPDLFEILVAPDTNSSNKLVFFKLVTGYNAFIKYAPVESTTIVSDYATYDSLNANLNMYVDGQVFYLTTDNKFYVMSINIAGKRTITESADYIARTGRSELYFQYRHNSPGYRRIDPSPSNLIDVFVLTKAYETDYRNWLRDSTNRLSEPTPPTTEDLKLEYGSLDSVKATSDTLVFNSARYKLLFGSKADQALQAAFKVVKNPAINISDNDIKSSVVSAINQYFSINNWDFGETFYFSELSAYLHAVLTPNISSIVIVPVNLKNSFGNLYQINAEANEIVTSCATVDNVEVISAITASQLNMTLMGLTS